MTTEKLSKPTTSSALPSVEYPHFVMFIAPGLPPIMRYFTNDRAAARFAGRLQKLRVGAGIFTGVIQQKLLAVNGKQLTWELYA